MRVPEFRSRRAPFFLEVIPLAPLVSARSALAPLRTREFNTRPLALFPTQICHGHSSFAIGNVRVRYRIPRAESIFGLWHDSGPAPSKPGSLP